MPRRQLSEDSGQRLTPARAPGPRWGRSRRRTRVGVGKWQSMEWTGSIRWIHNPVQSMRIWIGLDQKFTNTADSGLDWI